jgi:hypothetical protein
MQIVPQFLHITFCAQVVPAPQEHSPLHLWPSVKVPRGMQVPLVVVPTKNFNNFLYSLQLINIHQYNKIDSFIYFFFNLTKNLRTGKTAATTTTFCRGSACLI